MSKLLPLLSDGFVEVLKNILKNTESKIATELLEAQSLIETYNSGLYWLPNSVDVQAVKRILEESINARVTDEVRALSIRKDVFEIAFTPKGKELVYSDSGTWSREHRQTGKPGRIIKKLMAHDYKEKDIEVFNNLLKSNLVVLGDFRLVSGTDITKYYNEDNYYRCAGTLGNSCMRYDSCESYFSVYEDHAKMLVYFKDDLVLGRALVWEVGDFTLLDRIYTCEDYLESQFKDYAREQGWFIREYSGLLHSGEDQHWKNEKTGETIMYNLEIKLNKKYEYMPYMDSFRYYSIEKNSINTFDVYGDINLDNTEGTYDGYTYCCDSCGAEFVSYDEDEAPDELAFSNYEDSYLCEHCRVWNDYLDDYISNDREVIRVHTNNGVKYIPEDYVLDNATSRLGRFGYFVSIENADGEDDWYESDYANLTKDKNDNIIVKD